MKLLDVTMLRTLPILFIIGTLSSIGLDSATAAEVSHEDIRDALLSLVTIFRDNGDKLERHEYRERQLGEQIKKALAGLDKRYRLQDQAIAQVTDRLKSIEAIIVQKDEREKKEQNQVADAVFQMQGTLNKLMAEIDGTTKGSTAAYNVQGSPSESALVVKLDRITSALESNNSPKDLQENLLKNFEERFITISGREFQKHHAVLSNILNIAQQNAQDIGRLPSRWEVQEMVNTTGEGMQELREDLLANIIRGDAKVSLKIDEKTGSLSSELEEVMKATTELQSMTESLNTGAIKSYEQLLTEVKGLSKVEQVMIQTADNVMDTKRRIEYGVHQILLEVGDLVKHQGKTLNGTVNRRFDDIESTILDNQSGALTNLTSTIEMEISQVWRQIGIMYQQLTASATALDRLQQQTDAYVNGSVKTMDSMEGKVGMITSRMTEVDENLNFLLGRLSLVTSEYNQIKSGLAGALDDIRNSFLEVQGKMKDLGPGPRPISEDKVIGNDVPSE